MLEWGRLRGFEASTVQFLSFVHPSGSFMTGIGGNAVFFAFFDIPTSVKCVGNPCSLLYVHMASS